MSRILYLIAARVELVRIRVLLSWHLLISWWFRRRARVLDRRMEMINLELAAARQERQRLLGELGVDPAEFDRVLQMVRASHPQADVNELVRLIREEMGR